jgi:hypothetical protein
MGKGSSRIYLFGDEAGNFDFSDSKDASKYFVICTVALADCFPGDDLVALRRQLAWEGFELGEFFHASNEKQSVRNRVYALIQAHKFRIDVTLMDKGKTFKHLQDPAKLYKLAWYLHLKHVIPRVIRGHNEVMVISASIGTKFSVTL